MFQIFIRFKHKIKLVSRTNIDRWSTERDAHVMVLNQVFYFVFSNARRRTKRSLVKQKKRRILPYVPSEDGARRLKQMASLASALTFSKIEFSNELTYMLNMDPHLPICWQDWR